MRIVSKAIDLAGTRRFLTLVLCPRPSLRAMELRRPIIRRRKLYVFTSHHRGAESQPSRPSEPIPSVEQNILLGIAPRSSAYELPIIAEDNISPESEHATTETTSTYPLHSLPLDNSSGPRILRSSRRRKSKSIRDIETGLMKLKDNPSALTRTTWPRARKDLTSVPPFIDSFSTFLSLEGSSAAILDGIDLWTVSKQDVIRPSHQYSDECTETSAGSGYFTAPSHFDEPTAGHSCTLADRPIFSQIDICSGAISKASHLRKQRKITAEVAARESFDGWHHNELCRASDNTHATDEGSCTSDDVYHSDDIPTLLLTMPTPMVPQSPIFVPQSPITVSKFFTATPRQLVASECPSDRLATQTLLSSSVGRLAPALRTCGKCSLSEFDEGSQCRACNERWMACKVWYRANDGGQRRWLTEPYIRPGECNETNRAIIRDLGVFGYCSVPNSMNEALNKRSTAAYGQALTAVYRTLKRRVMQAGKNIAEHLCRKRRCYVLKCEGFVHATS